jgi:7-carboxy-7-deazaguanine synthase
VWCDSAHAVLAEEVRKLPRKTIDEVIEELTALKPGPEWLTISGGNPALYDLDTLVSWWQNVRRGQVAVETQGSRWKDWLGKVNMLTVSPKPPSSTMDNGEDFGAFMQAAELAESVNPWKRQVVLKVVVFDEEDYKFARQVHLTYPLVPFYLSCGTSSGGLSGSWVPPVHPGETAFTRLDITLPVDDEASLLERYRWLCETTMTDPLMAKASVLPQLHALTWGIMTRGV